MIFSFGKKKDDPLNPNPTNGKKRSMDSFESELNDSAILSKDDLSKLGGGKTSNKSRYDEDPYLQNTLSSTIPL